MFFFIITIASGSVSAVETVVHPGESIQRALNYAPEGGAIIIVEPGIYYQYVEINKDNLTLRSAAGPDETFIFGTTRCNDVIQVIANNATIDGFSVSVNATTKDYFNNNNSDVHGICLNSNINNCVIENNNVTNTDIGINLDNARDSIIKSNIAVNNVVGINLFKSDNNLLTYNLVRSNDYGIKLQTSNDNLIYNNSFNNTINADDNKANIWNTSVGNYWSDYNETEFDENGIGVIPYEINPQKKSIDYRPLMNFVFELPESPVPSEPPALVLPAANFESNVTLGEAPLPVEFTDLSVNSTGRTWDFNNDGVVDSSEEIAVYVFANPGTYTVNLTAINENGTASKLDTIEVLSPSEPPAPILPTVNFEFNVTSGVAPLAVEFTDLSENADNRAWDFNNDGLVDSSKEIAVYVFVNSGTYTVNLTVSNENGTVSKLATIEVLAPSEPSDPVFPIANFSSNVTSGEAPFTVQFIDLSENADSCAWDFDGDGDVDDASENPVYTYESAGNYTVNLTVSNGNGSDSKEIADFIIVKVADVSGDTGDSGDAGDSGETGDSENSVSNSVSSSHHSGGNGVGSAKIIRKEKLEPVGESDLASGSNSPGENSEKSDEYKALKVQSDMANHVEASGSEQEESGGSLPWISLPGTVVGLLLVAYLMCRGKNE